MSRAWMNSGVPQLSDDHDIQSHRSDCIKEVGSRHNHHTDQSSVLSFYTNRFRALTPPIPESPSEPDNLNNYALEAQLYTAPDDERGLQSPANEPDNDKPADRSAYHAKIIKAAEKLRKRKREVVYDSEESEGDYWPIGGIRRRRSRKKRDSTARSSNSNTTTSNLINSTSPLSLDLIADQVDPSCVHKFFPEFPPRDSRLPKNWTLHGLCRRYPNHLHGNNLIPFWQHKWSASRIMSNLPDQSRRISNARVTQSLLQKRMARVRAALQHQGVWEAVMQGKKYRKIGK